MAKFIIMISATSIVALLLLTLFNKPNQDTTETTISSTKVVSEPMITSTVAQQPQVAESAFNNVDNESRAKKVKIKEESQILSDYHREAIQTIYDTDKYSADARSDMLAKLRTIRSHVRSERVGPCLSSAKSLLEQGLDKDISAYERFEDKEYWSETSAEARALLLDYQQVSAECNGSSFAR